MGNSRFLSGSAVSATGENFAGFVALSDTTVTHIGYGHGKFTKASPNEHVFPSNVNIDDIAVAAGTEVPIKFSSITINGSVACLLYTSDAADE